MQTTTIKIDILVALSRFLKAQEHSYETALREIRNGRKMSHWIWYIFPQIKGLGKSVNSEYYGITDRSEAEAFLAHPILGARLRLITEALLAHKGKKAEAILGGIDAMKVRSSMTLFDLVSPNDIFAEVLNEFYYGRPCGHTKEKIGL